VSTNENDNAAEMVPRFEAINRQQLVLRPVDIEELIEPHHPARNNWEFLGELDLSPFAAEVKSVEGHAGRSAWEPRLLITCGCTPTPAGSPQHARWNGSAVTNLRCGGSPGCR